MSFTVSESGTTSCSGSIVTGPEFWCRIAGVAHYFTHSRRYHNYKAGCFRKHLCTIECKLDSKLIQTDYQSKLVIWKGFVRHTLISQTMWVIQRYRIFSLSQDAQMASHQHIASALQVSCMLQYSALACDSGQLMELSLSCQSCIITKFIICTSF